MGTRLSSPGGPAGVDLRADEQAEILRVKGGRAAHRNGFQASDGVCREPQHRSMIGRRGEGGRRVRGAPPQLQAAVHHLCRVQAEQLDGDLGAVGGDEKDKPLVKQLGDAQPEAQVKVELQNLLRQLFVLRKQAAVQLVPALLLQHPGADREQMPRAAQKAVRNRAGGQKALFGAVFTGKNLLFERKHLPVE